MTPIDWYGFTLASIAVVLAPGPGSVFVAKSAAAGGVRAGVSAMFGIMLGDTCLIILSLVGVSALFTAYPALFHTLRLIGACYLIVLGIQALLARTGEHVAEKIGTSLPFKRAVGITLLNPKAVFFFMAFFPVFIKSTEQGLAYPYALMTTVFMSISLLYLLFLSSVSAKVGTAFKHNRLIQVIARKACGCIFIGFGIKVAMSR